MTPPTPYRRPSLLGIVVAFVAILGLVGGCVAAGGGILPAPSPSPAIEVGAVTGGPSSAPTPDLAGPSAEPTGPAGTPRPRVPAPAVAPVLETPAPTPIWDPRPAPGPFDLDLYEPGDFASQATKDLCLPAAALTMLNIMSPGAEDSMARQLELLAIARANSSDLLRGPGAEPEGWAAILNEAGVGPYAVRTYKSRGAAVEAAAMAIRSTAKPVGIVAWRGHHSWVMSGFRATADPAWSTDFGITHVYIEDPWYPRVSSIWGASREPGALVPVERLGEDILPWRQTALYPDKHDRYVLILPLREGLSV
jgi:hypothetical protein